MQCAARSRAIIVLLYKETKECRRHHKAIKTIPYHLGANDNNASEYHRFCPYEKDSWCQYQSAKFDKRPPPHHPSYLSQDAVNIIYRNL